MKRNTFKDITQTFAIKIIYLLGNFVISIMLARLLGPSGKGLVAALFVMPNLLTSLADLGVRQAAAYTIGQKEHTVQDVFSASLVIWVVSSLLSVSIFTMYVTIYSSIEFGWILTGIALLFIPLKIIDAYYYGIHQGLQQIEIMNKRHLIAFIGRFLTIILLVWAIRLDVTGAALAMVVSVFGVGVYSYINTKSFLKISLVPKKGLPLKLLKRGIVFALALFIMNANYRIDIIILERFVSSNSLGIYTTASGLAELVWQLPSAIAVVIFSSSANRNDDQSAFKTASRTVRVSLFISVIGSILFALVSEWIVPLLYGQDFIESAGVINILLPGIVVIIVVQILHATLSGRGYPLMGFSWLVAAVLINIGLNSILIPDYSIYGAAAASTISYTVGGLGFSRVFSKKMDIPMRDFLIIKKTDLTFIWSKIKSKVKTR